MLHGGGCVGFPDEPLAEGGIGGELGWEEFECDLALGEGLRGEVDLTDPAAGDQRLDAVAGDLGADRV
jgi:hypothetical protein